MIIVAIVPKTTPVGTEVGFVRVEEFRKADTTSEAMTSFTSKPAGVYDSADYNAYDTGWDPGSRVPRTAADHMWCWNYDTTSLVEKTQTEIDSQV